MKTLAELLKDEGQTEEKYTIYCDMDGVLCNFEARFLEILREVQPKRYSNTFVEKINSPDDFIKETSAEEFWHIIDHVVGVRYWVGMNWTPSGVKLWNFLTEGEKPWDKPTLLTSPSRHPNSRLGKRLWVKNHIPGTPIIFKNSKYKQEMATPTSILIDDRQDNIDRWREAGGIGIHCPQNTHNIEKVFKEIREVYEGKSSEEGV